uniref:Cadherin domain-containing protein n=1 Tax=Timema monikensis TaxID=170555 RepID=A0A7R9E926_9NEOP|nr:unnamed protein product [Timema monikensis]
MVLLAGSPPLTGSGTVRVIVQDVNDHSPEFELQAYSASVMENLEPGTFVLQPTATDQDQGLNAKIRYSLLGENVDRFTVDPETGLVQTSALLDRERTPQYYLTLVARDSSETEPRASAVNLTVTVLDDNDNSPSFSAERFTVYVPDRTRAGEMFYYGAGGQSMCIGGPAGQFVFGGKATDADTGANSHITFSLSGADADKFTLDPQTGVIKAGVELTGSRPYVLQVDAMDGAKVPRTASAGLEVRLRPGELFPTITAPQTHFTLPEDSAAGRLITQLAATSPKPGPAGRMQFQIAGGNAADALRMDVATGEVVVGAGLDFESAPRYTVWVEAQDSDIPALRSVVQLVIDVTDANDNPPVMESSLYNSTIMEEERFSTGVAQRVGRCGSKGRQVCHKGSAGVAQRVKQVWLKGSAGMAQRVGRYGSKGRQVPPQSVITVRASDADSGINGEVTYRLTTDGDGSFEMDSESGEIFTSTRLDRESVASYQLTVEALDRGSPQLTGTATVRGITATIYLEGLEDSFESSGIFETKGWSCWLCGQLLSWMQSSRTLHRLRLYFFVQVMVTVLDKNDNPPRFTRLFSVNVTENADPGAFVIRVTSSDQDIGENANASYILVENPGEKFAIDPLTGNVTVAGPLDRETQDEYLLKVGLVVLPTVRTILMYTNYAYVLGMRKVAALDGSWRADTPLTITIMDQNDNSPEFEHSYYNFHFPELQQSVVFVGQVAAIDRDKQGPNSIISYSLKYPSDLFTVDPASGELFSKRSLSEFDPPLVRMLTLLARCCRYKHTALESSPENQYMLTVMATDNGKPPMSSECLVTVNVVDANNNPPQFDRRGYFSPVPESAILGQQVMKVAARDDKDFGVNAEIEYIKTGGNGSELFDIGKKSGWFSVSRTLSGRLLQYYTVTVRAVDKGVPPRHDEVAVVLVVTGENKLSPVFTALSYQVIVPENEPVGSVILTLSAADGDEGPNGMVRYSISSGNEQGEFGVSPVSGTVTIRQPLDYDTVQEYRLNITATDLGFEPRAATAMLTVTLTDVNDNAPKFNQSVFDSFIPENSPPKSFVYRVKATDADSPKNAVIQYSIVGGSGKDLFIIESKTGEILSKNSFDYEEKDLYVLDILAANPDSTMYGSTKVRVHITGTNEYYPRFIQPVFHFDVSESAEVGTSVGLIQATDQDNGEDGKVYYLFVGSSNDRGFSINPETAEIRVSRHLDRETQSRVVLTVLAKNAGGIRGNDTDEAQVIVSVQDGNDPPEFLQSDYEAEVSEGASTGTRVLTVKAIDKDVRPQNNQFSYSIIGGNTGHAFKVDPQTGDVETTSHLDRETITGYVLTIGAIDVGAPPQTGTTTVRISVTDINDNGPVLDPPDVMGYVSENEPAGTSVMTLGATDPDLPPNGAPFMFNLAGGRHRDMVSIEKHTGVVRTTKSVDREQTPKLEILVSAAED